MGPKYKQGGIVGSGRMKKGGKRKMYEEGGFLEPGIETLFDQCIPFQIYINLILRHMNILIK